jgi:hypothetical protein
VPSDSPAPARADDDGVNRGAGDLRLERSDRAHHLFIGPVLDTVASALNDPDTGAPGRLQRLELRLESLNVSHLVPHFHMHGVAPVVADERHVLPQVLPPHPE